jgi:hypothetical protein
VDNPNYFGVSLNKVELDVSKLQLVRVMAAHRIQLTYPINNYPVGGGVRQNIDIKANTQTNFTFPFSLSYSASDTSGTAVLQDIVTKCGAKADLTVKYNLKVSHQTPPYFYVFTQILSSSFPYG